MSLVVTCTKCSSTVELPRLKTRGMFPFDITPLAVGWSFPDSTVGWHCPDCPVQIRNRDVESVISL